MADVHLDQDGQNAFKFSFTGDNGKITGRVTRGRRGLIAKGDAVNLSLTNSP